MLDTIAKPLYEQKESLVDYKKYEHPEIIECFLKYEDLTVYFK